MLQTDRGEQREPQHRDDGEAGRRSDGLEPEGVRRDVAVQSERPSGPNDSHSPATTSAAALIASTRWSERQPVRSPHSAKASSTTPGNI